MIVRNAGNSGGIAYSYDALYVVSYYSTNPRYYMYEVMGDGGSFGPSSTTHFYSIKDPIPGAYCIVLTVNGASDGGNIFYWYANDDNEFMSIISHLTGTTYSTMTTAFVAAITQGYFIFNRKREILKLLTYYGFAMFDPGCFMTSPAFYINTNNKFYYNYWGSQFFINGMGGSLLSGSYTRELGSFSMDGSTTWMSNSEGGSVYAGIQSFTLSIWYSWNGVNQSRVILYVGDAGSNGFGIIISNTLGSTGNYIGVLYGGLYYNALDTVDSGSFPYYTVTDQLFHHYAATFDGNSTCKFYVDGVLIAHTSTKTPNWSGTSMSVGLGQSNSVAAAGVYGGPVIYGTGNLSDSDILFNYNSTAPRYAYSQFNSGSNTNLTYSNGNLTVSGTGSSYQLVLAQDEFYGTMYYEIQCTNSIGSTKVGIGPRNTSKQVSLDSISHAYWSDGQFIWNNGTKLGGSGTPLAVGDWIGFAVNTVALTLSVYKNGVLINASPISIASDTYFPAISINAAGGTSTWTANFGQNAWNYAPPGGYLGIY